MGAMSSKNSPFASRATRTLYAILAAATLVACQGGSGSEEGEGQGQGQGQGSGAPDAGPIADGFDCTDVDDELTLNCSIDYACSGMDAGERGCIDQVMAMEWFRPPCEEYAQCLSIPLFDCVDTDAELSQNCAITEPCAQMTWEQRFCLSDLMSMEWAQPPCPEYAACLQ